MKMNDQVAGIATEQLPVTTRLAFERTRGGYQRTMMAWIRTGTSLITFGFAVYKFFQLEMAGTVAKSKGLIDTSLVGPREFGMILIGIGLLSILLGAFEHRRDLGALRREYPDMPQSGSQLIAVLMAIFGALALVAVIYRY
jgi:putative membrane protein